MELSINIANILGRYPLKTAAELYRQAGFTACDYSLGDMVSDSCPLNSDNWREAAAEIRRTAEQAGLPINQTHAPFTFRHWDDSATYRDVIYPRLCRSVEISALLGARVVVMHPLHHFVYHGHEQEIFEANMEFYRSLIPLCREYNIKVGVENMYQVDPRRKHIVFDTCATKEEFVRYIDTLDSEYMVACLDLGHVGLPLQDDEAQDFIRALGHDRLQALHVHDNNYRGDDHNLPYFGRMNWPEITRALGEINYSGDFTYEINANLLTTMDDAFVPVGMRYMADVGKHLIDLINAGRKLS